MLADMELRQLRYFVAVAENGNISRAAQTIFLTQPALSRQIKALEDEIGQCLLERQAHSIRLTPIGEALLREARELLQHADQVLERVRAAGRGVRLRVGYAPSLASGILSVAVENFTQAHPNAKVELFDLSSGEMLAELESNKLDIIVTVASDTKTRGLKWTPLVRTAWKLAVNRKHPFARRQRVTPTEVAGEPLLVFCQRDFPEYWEIVTGWLSEHRVRPRITGEYDGVESLMAAVEAGQGVALVTARTEHLFRGRAQLKALSDAPKPLCIAAGYRTDRGDHQPLAVFVEDLRIAAQSFA
ncbi:MAG: LysR family transcriptional regulator [Verrucomicrobia bacterium]|nr:LysR family transcriptional regulator [Verrucomicrobiota bacterium]